MCSIRYVAARYAHIKFVIGGGHIALSHDSLLKINLCALYILFHLITVWPENMNSIEQFEQFSHMWNWFAAVAENICFS